jgi:hypothetical protein
MFFHSSSHCPCLGRCNGSLDAEGMCRPRVAADLGHSFVVLGIRTERRNKFLCPTMVDYSHRVAIIDHELHLRIPYALWPTW